MNNNDILRSLRYTFDLSDSKMMTLMSSSGNPVTRAQVSDWLKREDDPGCKKCDDIQLAIFLNGFIDEKRGARKGVLFEPEKRLNNNIIIKKLKIALSLKDTDVLEILDSVDLQFSKHELSAFFRRPEHRHYRKCKDQVVRNFLKGLQRRYRPEVKITDGFTWR